MRIAIDASSTFPPRTGVGNYACNLIRALAEIDKENEYVLYFNWFHWSKVKPEFRYPNFRDATNRIPARIQRVLQDKLHLPIEFFTGKIDVFHQPNYLLPPIRECKTVVTIHDMVFWRYPETRISADVAYFGKRVPISCEIADRIVVDSLSSRNEIVELLGIKPDKIEVIYPGITKSFCVINDTLTLETVRRRYGLPQEVVLYVGTLEPRKNIPMLIQVFAEMKKHRSLPHKLVIGGGKGWLYEDIFAKVKKLELENEIIFTGYVPDDDLPALYNLADLFVYPSLYEGFGLPVLEAMACGTPVVASDTSSIPEIVGDAGVKIDPTDIRGWADAVQSVLSDGALREELKQKGLERAGAFSWEKAAKETLEVYKEVAGSSHKA